MDFYLFQGRYGKTGIKQLDFIMVTGTHMDHPSFAHAIISRYLVAHGYSVGIIAQPGGKLRMISSASEGRGLDS